MQESHQSLYCTKTWYQLYISDHYGSLQKMLTLFNFVWNTQKNKWTIFFECPGKMFLSVEKVLKKISEGQPYMHCLIVFLHIFERKVSQFY